MPVLTTPPCNGCGAHAGEACLPECDDESFTDAEVRALRRPRPTSDAWVAARVRLLRFVGLAAPASYGKVAASDEAHPWWNVSLRGVQMGVPL